MRIFRRKRTTDDRDEISCQRWVELVTDYVEGALAPEVVARIDQHLRRCQGCANYLEQMRTTIRAVGRLDEADTGASMPRELRDALLAEFRNSAD